MSRWLTQEKDCSEYDFIWNWGTFKVLGIVFSYKLNEVMGKMHKEGFDNRGKRQLSLWRQRYQTAFLRESNSH